MKKTKKPIKPALLPITRLSKQVHEMAEPIFFIGTDANGKNHKVSKEIYDYVCKNSTDSYNEGRREGIILSVLVGVILAVGVALLMHVT